MIFTDRKITIRNGKSSINEPVILYRGDYEVSIKFTIMESKFRFKSGVNLVDSEKASFGQLAILAPYGGNVFSEVVKCEDGTVTFTLTKEMIDQLEEVGLYSFQIRLFDYYRESRVSIPPVEFGIEVREPVASEDHDNTVNNAIVGYSIAKVVDPSKEDVGDTFNDNGQYNKTDWETGDRITEGKLNKIEDAIDKINQNEINDVAALDKRVTNNFNVLDANKADKNEVNSKVWGMANMGQDVKEAMTGGSVAVVGNNAVLTNNIGNRQVTLEKTDFLKHVGNIFNKYTITPGKKIQANNTIIDDVSFSISDKILYDGQLLRAEGIDGVLRYDIDGKLLGSGLPTPENPCYYFIVSFGKGAEGGVFVGPSDYTGEYEYKREIPYLSYKVDTAKDIEKDSITIDKMEFAEVGANLFNKDEAIIGYTLDANGNIVSGYNDQFYADIEVKPNTRYTLKAYASYGKIFVLDDNKKRISTIITGSVPDGVFSVTTEGNARYIRYNSVLGVRNSLMICEGNMPGAYERYKHIVPYLEIDTDTAIPNKSITSEKISDDIMNAINALPSDDVIPGATVLGDAIGKDISTSAIWSSNAPTITRTPTDEYVEMSLTNSTTSTGIIQFAPKGFTNTGSGEVYVHLVYEAMSNSSNQIGVFKDNNAGQRFSLEAGEHEYVYKTSSTGGYALKYEISIYPNQAFNIRLKRVTILDFAGMGFLPVDAKMYFNRYDDYNDVSILKPFIYSASVPDKLITENMLDDSLYNMITPSKWAGKTFVSYGDSNTAGGGWQDYAVTFLGLTHVNKGIGGTTLCGNASSTDCGFSDARINSFPAQVDVVTIMFGTNDWSQNKTIGEDDGDVTTFKGAMGVTIRKIQEKYPKARIIIMSPPFRADSTWDADPVSPTRGAGILGFGDCCSEMARKYGCSFIDAYRDMGVNIYNFKEFLKEETWPVHLNNEGQKRLGRLLVSKLKEIEPLD